MAILIVFYFLFLAAIASDSACLQALQDQKGKIGQNEKFSHWDELDKFTDDFTIKLTKIELCKG